ncbi:MAG: protein-tyrosine phosphatase family protein [Pseudomonadota bacterium]
MKTPLYSIQLIGSGLLSIMPRPNASNEMSKEFEAIAATGIKCIVSLLETQEALELGLKDEALLCAQHKIDFLSHPIPDFGLPDSVSSFSEVTRLLYQTISNGIHTVIHCRGGIGRSGLVAAGVLLHAGYTPQQAFEHISTLRQVKVPETEEQYSWLVDNQQFITLRV